MEVGKVCVDFDDPVGLDEQDGADEDEAGGTGEERLDLHPGDDIVQRPRGVEQDGADAEPPAVGGRVEQDPEAVPDAEDQLEQDEFV